MADQSLWGNVPLNEAMPFGAGTTPQGDPTMLSNMLAGVMNIPKHLIDAASGFDPNDIHGSTARVTPAATETAMALAGTGAPAAEAGAAGIFGGRLARTADLPKLFKAEDMLDAGKSMGNIHNETGWFNTPTDKSWKFEIPDTHAKINSNGLNYANEGDFMAGPAQAMVNHPELFQAYPQLKDNIFYNTVLQKPANKIGQGSFNPNDGIFEVEAPTLRHAKVVGMHELQHGVQDIEGFSPGGNPSHMAALKEKYPNYLPEHERASHPMDTYERLGGEVEARNVMNRSLMDPEELANTKPWHSMDTPWTRQLMYNPTDSTVRALLESKDLKGYVPSIQVPIK